MTQAPKFSGSLPCLSCLRTPGSWRLVANLPCICWVVQWSHVMALNLPIKGDFLIIFKFCPHFSSLQPPGPEIWVLLVLRLHSWLSLQYLDAVMTNSVTYCSHLPNTCKHEQECTIPMHTNTQNHAETMLENSCEVNTAKENSKCVIFSHWWFCVILHKC